MTTDADRAQLRPIFKKLFDRLEDEGPITVWGVWGAVTREMPASSYDRFKRLIRTHVGLGHLELSNPGGTKKVTQSRMHISLTDAGSDWWESLEYGTKWPEDSVEAGEVDAFVGKRIRSVAPVPRDVWQALMKRHKAGELDIAFIQAKK